MLNTHVVVLFTGTISSWLTGSIQSSHLCLVYGAWITHLFCEVKQMELIGPPSLIMLNLRSGSTSDKLCDHCYTILLDKQSSLITIVGTSYFISVGCSVNVYTSVWDGMILLRIQHQSSAENKWVIAEVIMKHSGPIYKSLLSRLNLIFYVNVMSHIYQLTF